MYASLSDQVWLGLFYRVLYGWHCLLWWSSMAGQSLSAPINMQITCIHRGLVLLYSCHEGGNHLNEKKCRNLFRDSTIQGDDDDGSFSSRWSAQPNDLILPTLTEPRSKRGTVMRQEATNPPGISRKSIYLHLVLAPISLVLTVEWHASFGQLYGEVLSDHCERW